MGCQVPQSNMAAFFSFLSFLIIHLLFVPAFMCQANYWRCLLLHKGRFSPEFLDADPEGRCEVCPGQEHRGVTFS